MNGGKLFTRLLAVLTVCSLCLAAPVVAAAESITFAAHLGGAMRACITDGTMVYALQEPKLHIIDISNPAAPVTISTLTLPGIGRRLAKQGNTLYIACWTAGLVIVDISDPAAPQLLSQTIFDTSAEEKNCETQDVGVKGDYAYVIDQIAGFITLDVSNPAAPGVRDTFKAFSASNYNGYDITIADQRLFLACEFDGLYIFDLSNPAQPDLVSHYPEDPNDTTQPKNFYKTILSGSTLYVAGGGGGFVILDVTNLEQPTLTSILNRADGGYGGVISITAIGSAVYLCTEFRDLYKIDVSDPAAPTEVAEFDVQPYHSLDIDSNGSTIVLANRDFGLRILDASSATINQIGTVESIGQIQDCQGSGDYAYVAGYHQGLQILNVADPQNPIRIATVGLEGNVNGVYVRGNLVYTAEVDRVADTGGYLEIIDVSSAAEPAVMGTLELPGRPFDVVVDGTTAYVAVQTEGIAVVDVSQPATPVLISLLDTPGTCYGLELRGSLIAAADGTRGPLLVDARDREQMERMTGGFDSGTIQSLAMWDTFIFAPGDKRGLAIADISMPSVPVPVAVMEPEMLGYEELGIKAATTFNSYLLTIETTSAAGQVRLFDIADPGQPVVLDDDATMFGDAIKITCSPDQKLAYGSSQIAGLFIYRLDVPQPSGFDIDGYWGGSGAGSSGIVMEIDQIRSSLNGTMSIIGKRRVQNGTVTAQINQDGSISGSVVFKGGTSTLVLSYNPASDTLSGNLSGAVALSDISFAPIGMRGQLPMVDIASKLSSSIAAALPTAANPFERVLLDLAGSALDEALATDALSALLAGASAAEFYLTLLGPTGDVAGVNTFLYPAGLWDTGITQSVSQSMTADICPDFKDDLKDAAGNADRLFSRAERQGNNGWHASALRTFGRAAEKYEEAIAQYYLMKPDCPGYDIAEFSGYYEGTIDFGFALGNVRFCVEQDEAGTITGGAIIQIGATGEKMGGELFETVNETLGDKSVINGFIKVFIGGTEAHILMIDWQHNPSADQWEGGVDVDLQPVNATAALKKVADVCPDTWDEEFAEVTGK